MPCGWEDSCRSWGHAGGQRVQLCQQELEGRPGRCPLQREGLPCAYSAQVLLVVALGTGGRLHHPRGCCSWVSGQPRAICLNAEAPPQAWYGTWSLQELS